MKRPLPAWLHGGCDAYFLNEPLVFLRRRWPVSTTLEKDFLQRHSPPFLRNLKRQGVELYICHYHKGFGPRIENRELPLVSKTIRRCKTIGLKTGVYIRLDNVVAETFFQEIPAARTWLAVDSAGRHPDAIGQYFRKRVCLRHPGYRQYLRGVIREAVRKLGVDVVHLDGAWMGPEAEACHCPGCCAAFVEFLRARYPTKRARVARFGFENLQEIRPPLHSADLPPVRIHRIIDPVLQEWIGFRCRTLVETLRFFRDAAKRENSGVVVEANYFMPAGANAALLVGAWTPWVAREVDAVWSESEDDGSYRPDGILATRARAFKTARAGGAQVFYAPKGATSWWEGVVFGRGAVRFTPEAAASVALARFAARHRRLWQDAESAAEVAVFRGFASLSFNSRETHRSAVLVEQTLLQHHIPFDILFDEDLANLRRYRALVLPNTECLSDEQIRVISRYVETGGGLVATEDASRYDDWARQRAAFGLAHLFGIKTRPRDGAWRGLRRNHGQGRVAYVAEILAGGPERYVTDSPDFADYGFTRDQWHLPQNALEIVQAVDWVVRGDHPVRLIAPPFLLSNAEKNGRRRLVHLLNFDAGRPVQDVIVLFRPSWASRVRGVVCHEPGKKPRRLPVAAVNGRAEVLVPRVDPYALLVVES
ncbi:MAG: beta-galactosidase trimerization domain-containing protein [Verrucomicrobia bacterium]|nr:beta-galactosidase trimerization domain-containing protein [Verrucomicrobiota bacterium]